MLTEKRISLHTSSPRRDFDRILCPTDLSPASDEALRYAVALSRAFNAKLFVCHSVEDTNPALHGQIQGLYHIKNLFSESIGPYVSEADNPRLDWEGFVLEGEASKT